MSKHKRICLDFAILGEGTLGAMEDNMRRIFSTILAVLFVLALVSCTQYVSFPLPDQSSGNSQSGEINEAETTKQFAREFSLIRAFQDAMNGEKGVSFDETASAQSSEGAQVTKHLSFSGYNILSC